MTALFVLVPLAQAKTAVHLHSPFELSAAFTNIISLCPNSPFPQPLNLLDLCHRSPRRRRRRRHIQTQIQTPGRRKLHELDDARRLPTHVPAEQGPYSQGEKGFPGTRRIQVLYCTLLLQVLSRRDNTTTAHCIPPAANTAAARADDNTKQYSAPLQLLEHDADADPDPDPDPEAEADPEEVDRQAPAPDPARRFPIFLLVAPESSSPHLTAQLQTAAQRPGRATAGSVHTPTLLAPQAPLSSHPIPPESLRLLLSRMHSMSHQYSDMYAADSYNRSPGSQRSYGGGPFLARQPSRHFDSFAAQMQPNLYNTEDHATRRSDISQFDRGNPSNPPSNYAYENHTWANQGAYLNGNMNLNGGANTMGGTGRRTQGARRANLPTDWMTSQMPPPPQQNMGMPSHHNQHMNGHNGPYNQQLQGNPRMGSPSEEELIPTAIVIKNIPFAVKKEQLVQLMTEMSLPLPYAFNYHFDQGVFRGLAFANFTTADETEAVIQSMNHMDLQGRKLRVEYKKMLPVQERERIERDKREKRGQLEEQHRPLTNASVPSLNAQASMNSLNSSHIPSSPSPVSMRQPSAPPIIDMNDPFTLESYTELRAFKKDETSDIKVFSAAHTPEERRILHVLAHQQGLQHRSEGPAGSRSIAIYKQQSAIAPIAVPQQQNHYNDSRRVITRAATVDFAEARASNDHYYNGGHTLAHQNSSNFLNLPSSPGLGVNHQNLRAAKSFADLRSYTPSPSQSIAGFPANASQTIARYNDYGQSQASGTPNLTPTSAGGQGSSSNDLMNGFNGLSLGGYDRQNVGRSNANGRIGQEREVSNAGPIGSQRPVNGNNYDDNSRNGASARPERQPRGPGAELFPGFQRPRQNGHRNHGSGELDLHSIEKDWDDNIAQDSSDRSANARY
ncbi:RNA-binding post-transcriptional regulator cip2 [Lachnellula suecica]|uniref:RNA-binding post-transcriptional regulator cip2 n=1 Tax=Lachnellula suecica TaxID=602035 RepID=A0A8T9CH25_9HELO|nr:RNA-binding post-transcriptional regulator cip2 [Lachnellula suecica]